MLVKILAPGFFARQDTRTPVKIAIVALLTNTVMGVSFISLMLHFQIPAAHAGLALATSLAAWLQAWLLFRYLHKHEIYRPASGWLRFFMQITTASLMMVILLWYFSPQLPQWENWNYWQRGTMLTSLVGGGGMLYFFTLWLCGLRLAHFRNRH
jgi:putative peptidoglycan lipid II flippase